MDAYMVPYHYPRRSPREVLDVFRRCKENNWGAVLLSLETRPQLSMARIIMDNHITTTILHQAITSKGDEEGRAKVIRHILRYFPKAAAMKNGYGSLPLHVITQRNTKIKSTLKESLIRELVYAYKAGLVEGGGTGQRTPLHIVFTDYVSARLTKMMIMHGKEACFIKDKKGWLPAHVACSRHCSPEKLRMLLRVNPNALFLCGDQGETLLSLAKTTATSSHPNYALIEEIQKQMDLKSVKVPVPAPLPVLGQTYHSPGRYPVPVPRRDVHWTVRPVAVGTMETPGTPSVRSEASDTSTVGGLKTGSPQKPDATGSFSFATPVTSNKASPTSKTETKMSAEALLLLAGNSGPIAEASQEKDGTDDGPKIAFV